MMYYLFLNYTQFPQRLPRPKGLICVAAARMLNFAVAGNRTQVAVLTAVSLYELDAPVYFFDITKEEDVFADLKLYGRY